MLYQAAIPQALVRFAARNATFLLALILMASPVAGLRPIRAGRFLITPDAPATPGSQEQHPHR
jgi:hypothetical protein